MPIWRAQDSRVWTALAPCSSVIQSWALEMAFDRLSGHQCTLYSRHRSLAVSPALIGEP